MSSAEAREATYSASLKLAMASGEAAEPLQYTTTVLRVSIHCEGCKKKVKKVLHNIEGVYKVTVDAAQHKVTVTGSLGADALIKRLHKAGKQAALWPAPASPAAVAKKPEEVAPAAPPPPAVEGCVKGAGADKAEPKPKEAAAEAAKDKDKSSEKKQQQPEGEGKEKKPKKEKKSQKAEAAKQKDEEGNKDVEVTATKEKKGSAVEPAKKESAAAEDEAAGEESGSGKKGNNKKKNKPKEGVDEPEAAAAEKPPPQPSMAPSPATSPAVPVRPHVGGFAYYAAAAQPVMSYNVAHPSSSVSYYAPTPMQQQPLPTPPPPPYGYPAAMMPEFMYGPPGMRSSPPQESYNNMFNEENANSCTVM
nr:unnamed protein product [Digitaria exilis]